MKGALTVCQASRTVPVRTASRAYGVANPGFAGTYTGATNGDIFTVSGSSVATTSSPVGTYPIVPVATGTIRTTHTGTQVTLAFPIPPAALKKTAANTNPTFAAANPAST